MRICRLMLVKSRADTIDANSSSRSNVVCTSFLIILWIRSEIVDVLMVIYTARENN